MRDYTLTRYYLSLSSFAGIAPGASHWWARVYWKGEDGDYKQADAQCKETDAEYRGELTGRFGSKAKARAAGIRLAHKLADGIHHIIIEGREAVIDPQPCLSAPGNLRKRLNSYWRAFEKLDGWEAPKDRWPEVQKICDRWTELTGDRVRKTF